jgi:dihydroorotase
MRMTLIRPDDWHLHLRDGAQMAAVLPFSARRFARAIVMPNLDPPVTTAAAAVAYRERICAALPPGARFEPLMTLYLTDDTSAAEVRAARQCGIVHAVKLYPAGATTNARHGVSSLARVHAALEEMQRLELPLLVHGEVTDPQVDVFDREAVFLDRVLIPLRRDFPALRVVVEHITTREAADYVSGAAGPIAATITAHHLLYNRNALFVTPHGQTGLRPHCYCLPLLKRERHRAALVAAATGPSNRFFLGTDSAPHPRRAKESACGCAGCFSAPAALELYAEAFERAGCLDRLERFASLNGPEFYRLPRNRDCVTLERRAWTVPATIPYPASAAHAAHAASAAPQRARNPDQAPGRAGDADDVMVPLAAGETLAWRLVDEPA